MASIVVSRGAQALGKTFSYSETIVADGAVLKDPTLAAAKTGTLSTRSSDTAGTLTMAASHGITDGAKIDIYWSTGQCTTATVGTVATNDVPFTGATGDVLPAQGTAITAMVQHVENFNFVDGDLNALCVGAGFAACSVTLIDGSSNVVGAVRVKAGSTAQKHYIWDVDSGATIPVSDDVATIAMTHGDSASSQVVTCLALVD
jgi:hypothetical protein